MSAADFARLLDVMLPGGGYAVAVYELYVDESLTQKGPSTLCVAGYVYKKTKAKAFQADWGGYLRRKGLPHFHMTDCAMRQDVFKGRDDTDEICRTLIDRAHRHSEFGVAISINESDYRELVGPRVGLPSAYAFALMALVEHVQNWKVRVGTESHPTAYYFEEGHRSQGDASAFLRWMYEGDALRARHGYRGHAFMLKATPGFHPADYLAWHWRLEAERRDDPKRRPVRADFKALLRPTDLVVHYSRHRLAEFGGFLERVPIYVRDPIS